MRKMIMKTIIQDSISVNKMVKICKLPEYQLDTSMLKILSCNVTIMVANMDKAIDFYTNILGFNLINRYGDHWAGIEGPDISIGLHPKGSHIHTGDNLQIGLRVEDLVLTVQDLSKKGIDFKIQDDVQVKLAFFKDPDGNVLYLTQAKG